MSRLLGDTARWCATFAIYLGLLILVPAGWLFGLLHLGVIGAAERLRDAYRVIWTHPLRPSGR